MRVTFVPESGVDFPEHPLLIDNATLEETLASLRAYHAENAWADELEYPAYAAAHYAGLAAITELERTGSPGWQVVPVQFGVLVVT